MAIVIKNVKYMSMVGDSPVETGDIRIEGQKITEIGNDIKIADTDTVISGKGKFMIPGLINCHNHAAMTIFRGYGEGLSLMDWLTQKIWPAEAKLTDGDVYWGTMLAHLEMIKSGTTTYADMYMSLDSYARAAEDSGIRLSMARGLMDGDGAGKERLDENIANAKDYHHGLDDRLRVMLGPHSPYTCSADFLKLVADAASKNNLDIHMHIAETKGEYDDSIKQFNMSPVKHMNELGILDNHVIAAHMVYLNDEDMEIVKEKGTYLIHNPQSNMKLASGIAPISKYIDKGINVALGTDGASSNNNLDMFDEMRSASLLQKVSTGDALAMDQLTTLKLATINGAKALNWADDIGTVEVGKKADLILIDVEEPHFAPNNDYASNLVFAAEGSDVDTVIIDGKLIMTSKYCLTMDEERIMYEVGCIAKRILG